LPAQRDPDQRPHQPGQLRWGPGRPPGGQVIGIPTLAAKAGLRVGELVTTVDGTATPDPATLADVLAGLRPGQTVPVRVARPGGPSQAVRVTLGQFPG
jgi:S1-C subfamily serine protease